MDDTVTISKLSITKATASAKTVTFNGKNQTAKITVKYGSKTLKAGTDYTVSGATKKNAGKYIVVITNFKKRKITYAEESKKFAILFNSTTNLSILIN